MLNCFYAEHSSSSAPTLANRVFRGLALAQGHCHMGTCSDRSVLVKGNLNATEYKAIIDNCVHSL